MKKRNLWLLSIALAFSFPLLAEEKKEEAKPAAEPPPPTGSFTVDNQIVSNYVFRGADMLASYWSQKNQAYGSFNKAFAYQPSLTWTTPLDGLTFNLWGSFALSNRKDKDVDGSLQTGPGTSDLIASNVSSTGFSQSGFNTALTANTPTLATLSAAAATGLNTRTYGVPNQYKETNGLGRADELDFTLDYTKVTSIGKMTMGFIHYAFANPLRRTAAPLTAFPVNPGMGASGTNYYSTEIYVGFALPQVPQLTFKVNSDLVTSYQYWSVNYSDTKALSESVNLVYGVNAGYQTWNNLQGWQDVTGKLGVAIGGFTAGFNFAWRPDMKIAEANFAGASFGGSGDINTTAPLGLIGGSVLDGKVINPALNQDFAHRVVNGLVSTAITGIMPSGSYTYNERQKLPHVLYWINFGYAISI